MPYSPAFRHLKTLYEGGEGDTLHVYTAGGGEGYTLHIHTVCGGKDTPSVVGGKKEHTLTSTLLAGKRGTPSRPHC
jgi:hypothetical protein